MKVYNEIKDIAPILLRYTDKMNPDIPDGYFIDLQDNVWQRLELKDENIPEKYFKSLNEVVLANVSDKSRKSWLHYIPGIAASIAILLIAAFIFDSKKTAAESFIIEPELAFYYLENNIDNWQLETFAEYEIIEHEDILETFTFDEKIENMYIESLDPEDLDLELLKILE